VPCVAFSPFHFRLFRFPWADEAFLDPPYPIQTCPVAIPHAIMSSELIAMPSAKGGDSEIPAVSSSCADEGAVCEWLVIVPLNTNYLTNIKMREERSCSRRETFRSAFNATERSIPTWHRSEVVYCRIHLNILYSTVRSRFRMFAIHVHLLSNGRPGMNAIGSAI
jgi:hypothetical protein